VAGLSIYQIASVPHDLHLGLAARLLLHTATHDHPTVPTDSTSALTTLGHNDDLVGLDAFETPGLPFRIRRRSTSLRGSQGREKCSTHGISQPENRRLQHRYLYLIVRFRAQDTITAMPLETLARSCSSCISEFRQEPSGVNTGKCLSART
jgi:hypothetical protein